MIRTLCETKIKKASSGSDNENPVFALYDVLLLITMTTKPHVVGEELLLPGAKEISLPLECLETQQQQIMI
jgi:hypothetical protein